MSDGQAMAIGVLAGGAAMYGVYWLFKQVYKVQHAGNENVRRAIGLPATVYVPIPAGGNGRGKVTFRLQDRTVESRETMEGLRQMFGDKVFSAIPSRVAIRNAHAAQMDIFSFATDAATRDAAEAFAGVVKEVARG